MSTETQLRQRSEDKCELCGATERLDVYEVPPSSDASAEQCVLLCPTCRQQAQGGDLDPHHWRCLNDSMWTPEPAVQVMAWRMLDRLAKDESWARDLLEQLYLDDETLTWAKSGRASANDDDSGVIHKDSNGAVLAAGDTVTLIKDLNVKGAGFTAKRGTAVRNISLVANNDGQIEGRVNGQQIVILTQFVKKSG